MIKRMLTVLVPLLVLGISSIASASNDWLTTASSSDWFSPANWSASAIPSSTVLTNVRTFQTHMNSTYMPIINSGDASAYQLEVGGDNDAVGPTKSIGTLTINSGTLTTGDYLRCGASSTSNRWGAIYMNGGTVNVGNYMAVGWGSTTLDVRGWLYMTGGTINITNDLIIGNASGASGTAYIHGGIVYANNLVMRPSGTTGTPATMLDFDGYGRLILRGNRVAEIQNYIDNGWISVGGILVTEYSGLYYDAYNNRTVLPPVPEPASIALISLGLLFLKK